MSSLLNKTPMLIKIRNVFFQPNYSRRKHTSPQDERLVIVTGWDVSINGLLFSVEL